ncbi:AI-2E family transporter [Branchiibius sp. NY16-3462-2]|uniref:AI-2E family transporter n=1 Tax=Branchiibius sp. NY16-3462-2 TaxID=1807500 RepID=UPI000793349F|nr:AI-2E family transporter [Branchiibius sp. NY16-3462-2]KYH43391.1 hypothetical protein AZH51_16660 [Branchiibius sp. NY16-3462-2]
MNQRPRRASDDVSFGIKVAALWSVCLLAIIAFLAALVWLLNSISLVTITVAVAIMITALLQPAVAWLDRRGMPHALAAILVYIVGIALLGLALWFVISQIAQSQTNIGQQLTASLTTIRDWLVNGPIHMSSNEADKYTIHLGQTIGQYKNQIASGAWESANTAIGIVSGGVFTLFAVLFVLLDNGKMFGWFVKFFPDDIEGHVWAGGAAAWRTLTAYMRSLVLLAAVNAVAMVPVMMIAGLPLVVPLAVLLFIGSLVPMVGVLVAGAVVVLIALVTKGITTAIVVAIMLVLIVQLFGNLLNPVILGKAVDIHPFAILVGVTGGTLLAGVFGAFVAVPFIAVVNNAMRAIREYNEGEIDPLIAGHLPQEIADHPPAVPHGQEHRLPDPDTA